MPLQSNGPAPYTSAPALLTVLERCRTSFPSRITLDLLIRYGVKESIGPRTIQSLRLLDLIDDDGKPTEALESLSKARPDDYKAELASHLRSSYAEVFAVIDPATADGNELRNAFWGHEPRGQIDAMIRLFLGLCEEAGIVEGGTRVAQSTSTRRSSAGPKRVGRATAVSNSRPKLAPQDDPSGSLAGLPPGLVGLLHQVPTNGRGWTTQRRDAFLTAFSAVLNFTVPTNDDRLEDSDDAEEMQ